MRRTRSTSSRVENGFVTYSSAPSESPYLPLYVAPLGGEHHDAHVPPGWIAAYLLANSVAVTTRDHDIEEHQIRVHYQS
jgi:hypothetical protein